MAYLFVVFLGNRDNCCISLCGLSCEQIIVAYLFVVFLANGDNCCISLCGLSCEQIIVAD